MKCPPPETGDPVTFGKDIPKKTFFFGSFPYLKVEQGRCLAPPSTTLPPHLTPSPPHNHHLPWAEAAVNGSRRRGKADSKMAVMAFCIADILCHPYF